MPQLGPGAAVSEVTRQSGGVDESPGCPLLGLNFGNVDEAQSLSKRPAVVRL